MKHFVGFVLAALLALAPAFAQAPQGWKMHGDHSADASDPDAPGANKFVASGSGFHATNAMAAIYWNPVNTVTGNYTLKGTFKLIKSSGYDEYYGLIFGGNGLEGAMQSYLYFMVTDDGTYLAQRATLALVPLVANAKDLLNVYHVIVVKPIAGRVANEAGGAAFAAFVVSPQGQQIIATFGRERFGRPLFTPDAGKGE